MNDIGRRIVQSGAYALLALGFVLACSLLLPAEQARTQLASRSEPIELPVHSGSALYTVPEPSAGQ